MTDAPDLHRLKEPLARVPTGVPGLDRILRGGLLRGGSYLFEGPSGTGKTLLANQIAYHHAATGGKVVYFSLLSESHTRLLQYVQQMGFFDERLVGREIQYLGGYQALEQGTKSLLDLIRQSLRSKEATLLIIDGLLAITERTDTHTFRTFLHELQVHSELLDCTVLMISPVEIGGFRPEHSAVDGILDFSNSVSGLRDLRQLRVSKFRGSGHLMGLHKLEISDRGIRVFPRMEALAARTEVPPKDQRAKLSTGVPELDEMMHGGVLAGTTTLVVGASGTGKTILGLSFLAAGNARRERALFCGFYESPPRLIGKAEAIGLPMHDYSEGGQVGFLWQLPLEKIIDQTAEEILTQVRERGVTRLVLDGLNGFQQAAAAPERVAGFLTALAQELRLLGVTTLLTVESMSFFGPELREPIKGLSALVENMVLLRYVEYRASVRRLIGILKLRDSNYDPALRELKITAQGIQLGGTFEGAESLLSGIARTSPS